MKASAIKVTRWYENALGVRRYVVGFGGGGRRVFERYVIFRQNGNRGVVGLGAFARWATREVSNASG